MSHDPLTALAMWDTWQDQVRAALPAFAASPWYVEQASLHADEVDQAVGTLDPPVDLDGRTRDVPHGARTFPTRLGDVTRMWVDGNIEIAFLRRTLPADVPLASLDVLDIGAGYGRLAVMLAPYVRSVTCVDAVPVSVDVCRTYTQQYAPSVRVLDIAALRVALADQTLRPTLAINIHSWNECSLAQILGWLDVLDTLRVPFLFTVSHGQNADESSYRSWGAGMPSFQPRLRERYTLVAEASIGISQNPHALWARRVA